MSNHPRPECLIIFDLNPDNPSNHIPCVDPGGPRYLPAPPQKTLGEFLNDDPPSLATERTRLAWFEEPHPELFYKEEDLRHFRENGISIGEEEGEGEGEFDYPTDDLDRHHHHHQYAQEGIFCDDEVEEQEEEEEDAFVMPSRVVPRARGGMVETESAAVEDREERGGKPLLTPEELSVGAAAFAAASAAYGRSSSSSAGSASPSSAAAAAATAAASAAAAAGAAVAGEAGFPSQDGVCSIRASGGIAERSSLEGGLGGKRRARQGPGGSTTAASSGTSSSRGLRSGSSGGSKWVSKQHQQQQQRQEQVAGGGKKRRTVMGINGRAGGCGASRNGAGESATNGVDENVVPPKRRRKAGGALVSGQGFLFASASDSRCTYCSISRTSKLHPLYRAWLSMLTPRKGIP